MTIEDFIAAGGNVTVTLTSPTGATNTVTLTPTQHRRGSCGWKHKAEDNYTLKSGDEVDVSIAMTIVVQASGKWGKGKKRWSKSVAEMYKKQYGDIPSNVEVA